MWIVAVGFVLASSSSNSWGIYTCNFYNLLVVQYCILKRLFVKASVQLTRCLYRKKKTICIYVPYLRVTIAWKVPVCHRMKNWIKKPQSCSDILYGFQQYRNSRLIDVFGTSVCILYSSNEICNFLSHFRLALSWIRYSMISRCDSALLII